jgi:hypothetical protein
MHHDGTQIKEWRNRRGSQQIFVAILSTIVPLAFFSVFMLQASINSNSNFSQTTSTTLSIRFIEKIIDSKPEVSIDEKSTAPRQQTRPNKSSSTVQNKAEETPAASITALPSPSPSPSISTENSDGVRLILPDSKTISRAYNDSKSEIQRMSERSGKPLNSEIPSKYEVFQARAEAARIPNCISPNEAGGGLLAAPVIAYKALAGKCK